MGKIGPSRSPAIYSTTRHRPYPQSRPHPQELCVGRSPVRSQSKGKEREIPLAATNYGPLTPKTPSWGSCLEVCPNILRSCAPSNAACKPLMPTARPHDGKFVESSRYLSAGLQYSRSQQPVTETSMPTQRGLAPQYTTEMVVSDAFRRPVTVQGHRSPTWSTRESEGTMVANRTWHGQSQHQQPRPTVTGSCGFAMDLSTPPVDSVSPPDGPHLRRPANQPNDSSGRAKQKYLRPVNVR